MRSAGLVGKESSPAVAAAGRPGPRTCPETGSGAAAGITWSMDIVLPRSLWMPRRGRRTT